MVGVRSIGQLREDQAALLAEYLGRSVGGDAAASIAEVDAVVTISKVTSVVTSDPTYGAHLVVQSQAFSGTPPAASTAAKPTVRVYPTPNRVVTDYSVGEFVRVLTCRGAVLGSKLA